MNPIAHGKVILTPPILSQAHLDAVARELTQERLEYFGNEMRNCANDPVYQQWLGKSAVQWRYLDDRQSFKPTTIPLGALAKANPRLLG